MPLNLRQNKFQWLHSSISYNFSSSKITKEEIDLIIKHNKENYVDSNTLQKQFNEVVKEINDIELTGQFCKNYLNIFQQRMEIEKALEVCKVAIDLSKKLSSAKSITSYCYFKAKQIILNNEQGNIDEIKRLSAELYAFYMVSKEQLSRIDKFKLILFLAQAMNDVDQFEYSEKILEGSLNMIKETPTLQLSKVELFTLYYIHFGLNYQKQNFQEASQQGLIAFGLIKNEPNTNKPQNVLVGLYLCFKHLKQQDMCQQVIQQLKQYPTIASFKIEDIDNVQFIPFRKTFTPKKLEEQKLQNQQQQAEDENKNEEYYKEIQKLGQKYLDDKYLQEGFQFFEKLSKGLDPAKDIYKILFLQDCTAFLYSRQQNFEKALEISLNTHQQLLKARNNILYFDSVTFQNIYFIKLFYYLKKDYERSVEWGKKFHSYCLKYNIFETNDEQIANALQTQISALFLLKQINEALQYCNFAITYLEKFKNKHILFEVHMAKASMYRELNHMNEVVQYVKLGIDYYKQNSHKVNPEAEVLYYQNLLYCAMHFASIGENENLLEFGKEYLQLRKNYEAEEDKQFINLRMMILYKLSQNYVKEKNFEEAEKVTKDCLKLAQQEQTKSFYNFLIFEYIPIAIKVKKLDHAEEYTKIALNIYEDIQDPQKKEHAKIALLVFQSVVSGLKKNFKTFLDFLEQQLEVSKQEDKSITKIQRNILKELVDDQTYSKQIRELIFKYNINLNQ